MELLSVPIAKPEGQNVIVGQAHFIKNPLEVIVARTEMGRGVVGVVDGDPPVGVETPEDESERVGLLRAMGYKLG